MPLMVAVPESVMFPLASGDPAVGRTWMPDQVMLDRVEPSLVSLPLTVMVMVLAVTVAVPELKATAVPLPATWVTVAVTVAAALN